MDTCFWEWLEELTVGEGSVVCALPRNQIGRCFWLKQDVEFKARNQ